MWKKFKNALRCSNRSINKNDINIEELQKMKSSGAIVVDVRSPQEYNEGHIENAISIPEYELYLRAKRQLLNKDRVIIVYCSTGHRSKKAQKELCKMGYTQVYNLYNGLENYWDFKNSMLK